jgi:hypothetical protein
VTGFIPFLCSGFSTRDGIPHRVLVSERKSGGTAEEQQSGFFFEPLAGMARNLSCQALRGTLPMAYWQRPVFVIAASIVFQKASFCSFGMKVANRPFFQDGNDLGTLKISLSTRLAYPLFSSTPKIVGSSVFTVTSIRGRKSAIGWSLLRKHICE